MVSGVVHEENLEDLLEDDEGRKKFPYRDTKGKITIGVGRNLTDVGLSDDEIDYLLANDLKRVRADLTANFPWVYDLTPNRILVLESLRFNLGPKGFRTFLPHTLPAIQRGDYELAGRLLLASKWAKDVGERAQRLVSLLLHG